MKACIYIRVSTEHQDTENQRPDIVKYCEYHGLEFDIFEDKLSGKNTERPGLQLMLDGIKQQKYNKVIVWKLSRLGRSTRDLLDLIEQFEANKCALISIKESIDLSTPAGRLMVVMLAGFNEFERENMLVNQRAGIERAKKDGVKFGRRPGKVVVRSELIAEIRRTGCVKLAAKALGIGKSKAYEILKKVA